MPGTADGDAISRCQVLGRTGSVHLRCNAVHSSLLPERVMTLVHPLLCKRVTIIISFVQESRRRERSMAPLEIHVMIDQVC